VLFWSDAVLSRSPSGGPFLNKHEHQRRKITNSGTSTRDGKWPIATGLNAPNHDRFARVALLQAPDRRFCLIIADRSSLPPAIRIPGLPLGAVKAVMLSASSAGNKARPGFRDEGDWPNGFEKPVGGQQTCGNQKHYREVRERLQTAGFRQTANFAKTRISIVLRPRQLAAGPTDRLCACQLDRSSTTANLTDSKGYVKLSRGSSGKKGGISWPRFLPYGGRQP
jgi:hypothetical protein